MKNEAIIETGGYRSTTTEPELPSDLFVARQPILNKQLEVYGYELLYRSGMQTSFDGTRSAVRATSEVITASFLNIGINRLVGAGRAFINFDRELLLSPVPEALPREKVVIEILETVQVDEAIVSKCRALKQSGYQIALDDFDYHGQLERLIPLADIIKIDFRQTPAPAQRKLAEELVRRGKRILAEKVETHEEFGSAFETGYTYFQGYFFATPTTVQSSRVNPAKLTYLKLLEETSHPELDFRHIEELLKHEPGLTWQLLRYLNSAAFSWNGQIRSIGHALALLGVEEFRRWAAIVILCGMGHDRPRALIACSVIRARLCELIGAKVGLGERRAELFLMGLFSMLDAILNQPFPAILPDLHLPADIGEVLAGHEYLTILDQVYSIPRAIERGEWAALIAASRDLHVTSTDLMSAYSESVDWANRICP